MAAPIVTIKLVVAVEMPVEPGGLIAGHDYENKDVTKAVNEFFENENIEVFSDVDAEDDRTHDWWCFKPAEYSKVIQRDSEILMNLIQESL